MIRVEKGKKIPPRHKTVWRKYPFDSMKILESFPVKEDDVLIVRSASCVYGKRNNMKFSTRKYENGFRCWRIS